MKPFLSLHTINFLGSKLLNQLESFNAEDSPKKDLQNLLRKSFIMSLLSDTYVIAVAGLQGVGKSTLITELYGLDNDILITNVGQGETLPILITEKNDAKLGYYVHKLIKTDDAHNIEKFRITNQEFKDKSHRYNSDEMILELEVPQKVFNGTDKHFLLLPGFQSPTSYLKELTYMSLKAASTCMVVFFKERYAHEENKKLITELANEFQAAKPLFVLTRFDHTLDDQFRKDVINDLQINDEEKDRVIESGIPGPENWQQKLIQSVLKYSVPNREFLAVQLRNFRQLTDEYEDIILRIQRFIEKQDTAIENEETRKVKRIVDVFYRERKRIEKQLEDFLTKRFEGYFSKVVDKINEKLGEQGFWPRFAENFRNSVAVQNEFTALVRNAFSEANETSIDQEFVFCLNSLQNVLLKEHSLLNGLLPENSNERNPSVILAGDKKNEFNPQPISEETHSDLNLLCIPGNYKKLDVGFSEKLENSIKLLPVLALEGLRVGLINPKVYNNSVYVVFHQTEDSANLMKIYSTNKREIAIGTAILFGMDVIPDGELNLFGLFHANATKSAASGASATMAGITVNWAIAALVAASAIIFMIHQLNRSLLDKRNTAVLAVDSMKNYCIKEYCERFNVKMDRMQDLLREILKMRYGLNEEYANIQNIYDTIRAFEKQLVATTREINDAGAQMGWTV
jgi:hypothetical protein